MKRLIIFYQQLMWSPIKYARKRGVKIGRGCSIYTREFGSEPYLIEIGDHVQLAVGVRFFTHGAAWCFRLDNPKYDFFGKIKVGNNVYIGTNTLIMPGITIGNDVIIGSGSVVTRNVRDGVIMAGNPAKEIGKVAELGARMDEYNIDTFGLSADDKRTILESLADDKFIRK